MSGSPRRAGDRPACGPTSVVAGRSAPSGRTAGAMATVVRSSTRQRGAGRQVAGRDHDDAVTCGAGQARGRCSADATASASESLRPRAPAPARARRSRRRRRCGRPGPRRHGRANGSVRPSSACEQSQVRSVGIAETTPSSRVRSRSTLRANTSSTSACVTPSPGLLAGVEVGHQADRGVAEGQLAGEHGLGVAGHADDGPAVGGEPPRLGPGREPRSLDDHERAAVDGRPAGRARRRRARPRGRAGSTGRPSTRGPRPRRSRSARARWCGRRAGRGRRACPARGRTAARRPRRGRAPGGRRPSAAPTGWPGS